MTDNNLSVDVILSRMEMLMSTYQMPNVTYADGKISIAYVWISDWAEEEYRRLVFALAEATP